MLRGPSESLALAQPLICTGEDAGKIQTFRIMIDMDDLEARDFFTTRNPWPWNENHKANKPAELEQVQFLPQCGG